MVNVSLSAYLGLAVMLIVIIGGCRQNPDAACNAGLDYPHTLRDSSIVDVYHGEAVRDPYRWLENDTSVATAAWVDAQNALTQSYLEKIPFRQEIKSRLERLYDYERFGVPEVVGEQLYYSRNTGLQNQSPIYREPLAGGEAELVLDPNSFSADNTASLAGYSISKDGRYFAYQISEGGSDWNLVKVLDLESLQTLPDELRDLKFSGLSWWKDGFFYSRYPLGSSAATQSGRNINHSVYYHRLGESQSEDRLVYQDVQYPERNVGSSVSDDEKHLIITSSQGTSGNSVAFASLKDDQIGPIQNVVMSFDHNYEFVHGKANQLLFWTDAGASNGRLLALDALRPEAGLRDVIAQDERRALKEVKVSGDRIYARFLDSVSSRLEVYSLQGKKLHALSLPGLGTTSGLSASEKGGPAFYSFSSFTTPGLIYRYDPQQNTSSVWKSSNNGFDASRYQTEQIWYKSKDGTSIPMFIIHRKGLELDGKRPLLLYGYGGFEISIEPRHSVMRLDLVSPILEQDGIIAVANIRGGGEFGTAWHEAGIKERKQNVFNDFIGAIEYLQKEGYTDPAHTAIYGRSNGGLLVGAVMTQRPELFEVAFPAVGVLDMLRYHKFTIGWAWASDYGRSDSLAAYQYLKAYSPLHNLRPAKYPATMITTADHDDRVVPAHSFKFAAELQRVQQSPAPTLIRIDKNSGHGAGKPITKQIDEATDLLAFMFYEMGVNYKAPKLADSN